MGQEINDMITRIIPQLQQLWTLIFAVSVLMGLILVFTGLYRLGTSGGRAGASSPAMPKITVLIGIIILNIPAVLDTLAMSTLDEPSVQALTYIPPESTGRMYIQLAVYLIQIIGLLALIRGWSLMDKIGRNGDSVFWKASTHIIGGFMAVNIVECFRLVGLSIGGPVQNAVSFTFG